MCRCDSKLELVGSCSTLVSEVLLADDTFTMDAITASLLHGVWGSWAVWVCEGVCGCGCGSMGVEVWVCEGV